MISIIMPAHNEERVIGKSLTSLLDNLDVRSFQIIVVCNGCTDKTVEKVQSFSDRVICIETPIASKTNAMNLGDAVAEGYPRFYMDADVCLSKNAISKVADALESGKLLAAAPEMRMELSDSSWIVRSYYDIWHRLPYVREGMTGAGVYALSRRGRKRFGLFPPIIADDGYVRALFKSHERASVAGCYAVVQAPKNFVGLLKIKTRSRLGVYELRRKFPWLKENEVKDYRNAVGDALRQVYLWPKVAVYFAFNIIVRLRAMGYQYNYGFKGWERDDTSRM